MKEFWSARARSLTPYVPGEQPQGQTFIKLNTNENPYPPSPAALAAIRAAADGTLRLYPDPECAALRQALAETYGLRPENVFVGNGSDEVLALCFQAFFDPGREILFPDVTYSFYPVFAQLYGLDYREVPLNDDFSLPLEPFLGGNGGVVIANPNAPTGRAVGLDAIRALLEGNPQAVVLVDEAYVDFGAQSAAGWCRSMTTWWWSTPCPRAGPWRACGWAMALGQPNLTAALRCVRDSINSYTVDQLAQAGGAAAMRDRAYFEATAAKVQATRERTGGPPAGAGLYGVPLRRQLHFYLPPRPGRPELWQACGKGRIGPLV